MSHLRSIFLSGIIGTLAANAGQIQIGGANGLTTAYINAGGSTTGWSERPYINSLFGSAAVTPTGTNSLPPQLSAGAGPGVKTMTAPGGVFYNTLNDGPAAVGSANMDVWASVTAGTQSITIPINIFGVQNIYVMLNDYYGFAGENATIKFNFASGTDTITLQDLANGTGSLRSAVNCTGATGSLNCPNPSTLTGGHIVSSSGPTTNTNTSGDATIVTSAIWKGTYSVAPGLGIGPYDNMTSGSSGNLLLDSLGFSFANNYSNTMLNSITITTDASNAAGVSRLALSAITAVTATPEPSTVALFATGLGLLGIGLRRRRSSR